MRIFGCAIALIVFASAGHGVQAKTPDGGPIVDQEAMARSSLPGPTETSATPTLGEKGPRLAQNIAVDPLVATSGNPAFPPLTWVGMLVVPNPSKRNPDSLTLCTAEFITPTVLLTAAHCLRDLPDSIDDDPNGPPHKWPDITKATFYRQYQNDSGEPFKIVCGLTNPKWTLPPKVGGMTSAQKQVAMNKASQHDYAMLLVDSPNPGGGMPYMLDWKGKKGTTFAIRVGYPGAILDAAIVQQVPGSVFFANTIPDPYDKMRNEVVQWGPSVDATQGMSGGAWIINFDTTGKKPDANTLIAVSSYANSDFPGASFAAYLTADEFNPLLKSVSNGCK